MRWLLLIVVVLGGGSLLHGDAATRRILFTAADAGRLPASWTTARTGEGEGSVWKVQADATTPGKSGFALTQTAAGPSKLFNLCVLNDSTFLNGELRVRIKPLAGKIDQGGGLVWRYQDANNYYICRYNPLETNYRVYKVLDGKRIQLATREELDLPVKEWQLLEVKHDGQRIVCLLNGRPYLRVEDDALPRAGKVGLWTKADAVTSFDELVIQGK